ncbi:NO-inducible flavohemoprotein [Salinithrix halophila]|uniref:Flavohemoprotein n=1 Tax=Salinithrix halophila TaxID=1485204 RepID=A0ABV8JCH9_9BACL
MDAKTIEIVKRTAPVLKENGKAITSCFYQRMFSRHPELHHLFNRSNQRQGKQQQALANAVYAAAAHIDRLEAILPAVEPIAHKHRALGVKPEQYPIVGENLLAAIREVLGENATEEVLEAWGEAYKEIARVFIRVEEGMYREAVELPGGWADFRPFRVTRKVKESEIITSFYLKAVDGGPLPAYLPGQYITVRMNIPGETYTFHRHYSLSDAPRTDEWRITVKREEGSEKHPPGVVSNYLHDYVEEGDNLHLSAPAGSFVLDMETDRPLVFLSGGVGLTPLLSMATHLVQTGSRREITWIHAAKNGRVHAMRKPIERLAQEHAAFRSFVLYESPTEEDRITGAFDKEGRIDGPLLEQILPRKEADCYLCGPLPFMKVVFGVLKEQGVDEGRIHYEMFGPSHSLDDTKNVGGSLQPTL